MDIMTMMMALDTGLRFQNHGDYGDEVFLAQGLVVDSTL